MLKTLNLNKLLLACLFFSIGGYASAESEKPASHAIEACPNVWLYMPFDDTIAPRLPLKIKDDAKFVGPNGEPVYFDGIQQKALSLTGNQLFVPRIAKTPFHSNEFPTESGSFVVWIKPGKPLTKEQNISFFFCQPSCLGLNIELEKFVFFNTSNPQHHLIGAIPETCKDRWENTWHCIVVSWDKGTQKLYLDGEEIGSREDVAPIDLSKPIKTKMYIGSHEKSGVGSFDGLIDEFVFFRNPLTATQVQAIYEKKTGVIASLGGILHTLTQSSFYIGEKVEIALHPSVTGDLIDIYVVSEKDGTKTGLSSTPCTKGVVTFEIKELPPGAYHLQIAVTENGKIKSLNAPMPINIYKDHIKFVQITDPHYQPIANHAQLIKDAAERIQQEYSDCDFVIITGDLITDPVPGLFEKFKETLQVFKIQPYLTTGNHDYYLYSEKEKLDPSVHHFREEYKKVFGESSYSFDSGGYHCIVLDSTGHAADIEADTDYYCNSTGKTKEQLVDDLNGSGFGLFRKEVLLWLENDLTTVSKTTPVIIFSHHSWGGGEKQWTPGFFKQAVANPQAVGRLLKDYTVVAAIAGHAHALDEFEHNGTKFYVTPRLAAAGRNVDDTPMGFKVFEIIGREIKTEYVVQPVPEFQPVNDKVPQTPCMATDQAPKIDGKLDDPLWKTCHPVTPFMLPHGSDPSKYPTTAFLTYDRQNLYLAFRCTEPELEGLVAKIKERDGPLWEDDSLEIFLDTNHDKKTYFHYIINTIGTVYDGQCLDAKWNGPVDVATGRETEAWIVEVVIPWKSLAITAPPPGTRMGLGLARNRQQAPAEESQWSPSFTGNHVPERFGILVFE